ncbi:hypothetical protein [Brenneria izbisi]|uniref:Uncharacterized protein n=1 Tax=Brenneria izbisi TaxID=2939450 RepID=A0AA41XWL9_9GAMM|nr:hypothetical protein [Brenneria izbisi]MCV9877772.1 hypothetical protein [Brenneria izbisi]MCV9880663.1 hypothetical protein [Brenneria izbisi]
MSLVYKLGAGAGKSGAGDSVGVIAAMIKYYNENYFILNAEDMNSLFFVWYSPVEINKDKSSAMDFQ